MEVIHSLAIYVCMPAAYLSWLSIDYDACYAVNACVGGGMGGIN